MEKETLLFVVAVSGALISFMAMIIIGLLSWSYRRDLAIQRSNLEEKAKRIEFLENELRDLKSEWMGRPETQGLVSRVEKEFIGRHETLSQNVTGLLKSIHDLRLIFSEQQTVWANQMHELGEKLNGVVSAQIDKCSAALMTRVSEQFKTLRSEKNA